MIEFSIEEIKGITRGSFLKKTGRGTVSNLSIDSRTLKQGDVFFAVKGKRFNGHDFLEEALDKGASGIIIDEEAGKRIIENARNIICVESVSQAILAISGEIRKRIKAKVIAVTGSNGKTTVKDYISAILSSGFNVLASRKSFNNFIGLGLTLFEAEPSHEIIVAELGSNHPGEIAVLGETVKPDMAVITNIGRSHLEFFESKEGVFREKISLLDYLVPEGRVFVNGDDVLLKRLKKTKKNVKTCGRAEDNDFVISGISKLRQGYRFFVDKDEYTISPDGIHNVYNAALAVSVARVLKVEQDEIKEKIRNVFLPPMRLERIESEGLVFINDAYNANPDSFEKALDVLESAECEGDRIVVAGDMLEMGEESGSFHSELGKSIANRKIKLLIAAGKWAQETIKGAVEAGMSKTDVVTAGDFRTIVEIIRQRAKKGSIILLKASREAKLEEILECFTTYSIL